MDDTIHDLTPAYALDALDDADRRAYEAHLPGCARCGDELAELRETVGSLAFGTPAPPPSPALRERILAEARTERSNVVPLRRRAPVLAAAVAAAAAVALAIGLGTWATSLSRQLDEERAAVEILADPRREVPLSGASGRLVADASGRAVLVVADLRRAPEGRTYVVWIIRGERPLNVGAFAGGRGREVVTLDRRVETGDGVGVTVEPDGDVESPSSSPLFSAKLDNI